MFCLFHKYVLKSNFNLEYPDERTVKCIKCGKEKKVRDNEICKRVGHNFKPNSAIWHEITELVEEKTDYLLPIKKYKRVIGYKTQVFCKCENCGKIVSGGTVDGKWDYKNGEFVLSER